MFVICKVIVVDWFFFLGGWALQQGGEEVIWMQISPMREEGSVNSQKEKWFFFLAMQKHFYTMST